MENKWSIPLAIVIAGLIIGGSVYLSNSNGKEKEVVNKQIEQPKEIKKVTNEDHILGSANAKVLIVEYSDTECPYCKKFHSTLNQVLKEYKEGEVAWVYRHFPIEQLHSKAPKEAEATECANELGGNTKFWEFINMVYDKTPGNNGLDAAELPKFAVAIGLDGEAFTSCLNSGKYTEKIAKSVKEAMEAGINGTPYAVVIAKDGTKTPIKGAYPLEQVKTIIDAALK